MAKRRRRRSSSPRRRYSRRPRSTRRRRRSGARRGNRVTFWAHKGRRRVKVSFTRHPGRRGKRRFAPEAKRSQRTMAAAARYCARTRHLKPKSRGSKHISAAWKACIRGYYKTRF
jgi:hypothetical protein